MDASLEIQGSIHDEKLIVQFKRRCPENWVHIIFYKNLSLYYSAYAYLSGVQHKSEPTLVMGAKTADLTVKTP